MAEYGLIKSFNIDNGELDGLPASHVFVLGYELALIDALLDQPSPIQRPVHAENMERIKKSCSDANRPCRLTWAACDPSESWLWLTVPPLEANQSFVTD